MVMMMVARDGGDKDDDGEDGDVVVDDLFGVLVPSAIRTHA